MPFYYILHFTIFGKLNFPSVEAPDSQPRVLCKEVGSRLVAAAPALRGLPFPLSFSPYPRPSATRGGSCFKSPSVGSRAGARSPFHEHAFSFRGCR